MDPDQRGSGGARREPQSLVADSEEARRLEAGAVRWPSYDLDLEQLGALELLLAGALAPLDGPLSAADAESVRARGTRLDGRPWRLPLTMLVPDTVGAKTRPGDRVALRDPEGVLLAALRVDEARDAGAGRWLLAGPVTGIRLPAHHAFANRWLTPARVREVSASRGWERAIAFRAGAVLPRETVSALSRLATMLDAGLLVQIPVAPHDAESLGTIARVQGIDAALAELGARVLVVLLPAVDAPVLLARNYGCTHLALEPDAAPPSDAVLAGALELLRLAPGRASASDLASRIDRGAEVPDWMASPSAVAKWRCARPCRDRRGFTVFFTGLSGSGKSTIANRLRTRLMEVTGRPVTLLDGDVVRQHLSSELGFSREHRDLNVLRIGYVASEITHHGGIAICCPIAPYAATRRRVREMVESHGGFVLVHVATSLAECERRDRKGLYARARAGLVAQFTGISDPYETPDDADVTVDTARTSADDAVDEILALLRREEFLRAS